MPSSPPTVCRCGGRRTGGVCDRCGPRKRQQDTRQHAAARGYDYKWQQFRKLYLEEHPLCCDCGDIGIIAPAHHIHHIQKLCDHPELKYEHDNLMGLCAMHHDRRTARGE